MTRIMIELDPTEAEIIRRVALAELRPAKAHIRYLIREALIARGLLTDPARPALPVVPQ